LDKVAVAVTEKPPFVLTARFKRPEGVRGIPVPLTIHVARAAGFSDEVALAPIGLPVGVTASLKNLAKAQDELHIELAPSLNAPLGTFPISFTGKAKYQNKDYLVTAPPVSLNLEMPFRLRAEPSTVELVSGKKATVRITATRQGGYAGPIRVELRNLPAGVTTPAATIPSDKVETNLELAAAPDAARGTRGDVQLIGIATAAGNQQDISGGFMVRVNRK
jgi:hypothetical protein